MTWQPSRGISFSQKPIPGVWHNRNGFIFRDTTVQPQDARGIVHGGEHSSKRERELRGTEQDLNGGSQHSHITSPISASLAARNQDQSDVEYHVPQFKIQRASLSARKPRLFWSYSLYENGDGLRPIARYCTQKETFERVADAFVNERILGFDLEWKAHARSLDPWWYNVSVIQLASPSQIGIFHLAQACNVHVEATMKEKGFIRSDKSPPSTASRSVDPLDVIPARLKSLLEDQNIIKTGVNIAGDRTRLLNHCGIQMRASFELSHLHKLVKYSATREYDRVDRRAVTLESQVEEHLLFPMLKGGVRTGDWASSRLNKAQIHYAATDAYACLMLFHVMDRKRRELDPKPPRPEFDELKKPIRLAALASPILSTSKEAIGNMNVNLLDLKKLSEDSKASIKRNDARSRSDMQYEQSGYCRRTLIKDANAFALAWRLGNQDAPRKATKAVLRAYFLWHKNSIDLPKICELLRSPPLQEKTVARYIWIAIREAKLDYDKLRFQGEIVPRVFHT